MEILTLENIRKVLEDFETKFPKHEIPKFAQMNENTKLKLCAEFKYIDFIGLPLYVVDYIPDNIVKIYNVNDELIHEIKIGD